MGQIYWAGSTPIICDACPSEIGKTFYDMRTTFGPWAMLCCTCAMHGPGIGKTGVGFGQKYELQKDGKWLKTAG